MQLNLQTENKADVELLQYLQENATEDLADKINNGAPYTKDGQMLLNKKTLQTFMQFAQEEAKKILEKGKNCVCVDNETVYGWLMHYFEEDSIEGELFNLDGSKYEQKKPVASTNTKPAPKTVEKPTEPLKPQDKQLSLFDSIMQQAVIEPAELVTAQPLEPVVTDARKVDAAVTEIQRNAQRLEEIGNGEQPVNKPKLTPFYQTYLNIQQKYPNAIIAYRLGDFYEVFGEGATKISNELDLTLTGRRIDDANNRVPMCGFPYHAADIYSGKIAQKYELVIAEDEKTVRRFNVDKPETPDDVEIFEAEQDLYDEIDRLPVAEVDRLENIQVEDDEVDDNGEIHNEQYKMLETLKQLLGVSIILR